MIGCSIGEEKKEKEFFLKGKTQGYTGELGSEIQQQPFPDNGAINACWYFLTHTEIIRKHTELPLYHFTWKYSGYRISMRNGCVKVS